MTGGQKVLVVDDESAIRKFLRISLEGHGYTIVEAENGTAAIEAVRKEEPDALILDLRLPDLTGVEVTRRLREWSAVPILFLSVQGSERTKIEALDAGADDFLSKPFSVDELLARLRANLRRTASSASLSKLTVGELRVDIEERSATMRSQKLLLTPTEFSLLVALMRAPGKVLTHRQLLQQVWGEAYIDDTHILRVNVCNLRRKLGPDDVGSSYLQTEPGVGYRLSAPRNLN